MTPIIILGTNRDAKICGLGGAFWARMGTAVPIRAHQHSNQQLANE